MDSVLRFSAGQLHIERLWSVLEYPILKSAHNMQHAHDPGAACQLQSEQINQHKGTLPSRFTIGSCSFLHHFEVNVHFILSQSMRLSNVGLFSIPFSAILVFFLERLATTVIFVVFSHKPSSFSRLWYPSLYLARTFAQHMWFDAAAKKKAYHPNDKVD